MFEIEYNLSNSLSAGIAKADEAELRYSLFLGGIILKSGNCTILIDWDWVPLLDFALCLSAICKHLIPKVTGEEEFEFTESDAKILFEKSGGRIRITTSFSKDNLECEFEEFYKAVRKFYKSILFEIVSKEESLKNNQYFSAYLKDADNM